PGERRALRHTDHEQRVQRDGDEDAADLVRAMPDRVAGLELVRVALPDWFRHLRPSQGEFRYPRRRSSRIRRSSSAKRAEPASLTTRRERRIVEVQVG